MLTSKKKKCCISTFCILDLKNLPCLAIPTAMHFAYLHFLHIFGIVYNTVHVPPVSHFNSSLPLELLWKKPLKKQNKTQNQNLKLQQNEISATIRVLYRLESSLGGCLDSVTQRKRLTKGRQTQLVLTSSPGKPILFCVELHW